MTTLGEFISAYIERVVNQRDISAVEELVDDDYRGSGLGWPRTRDELRAFYEDQARTRPDWHIAVRETVELGDSVVVRAHAHGTVTEGDNTELRQLDWLTHYRVKAGRITEINVLEVSPLNDD